MSNLYLKEFIKSNFHNCDDTTVEAFRDKLSKILTLDKNIVTEEMDDNWDEEFVLRFNSDINSLILSVDRLPKWMYANNDSIESLIEDMLPAMYKAYIKDGGKFNMTERQIDGLFSGEYYNDLKKKIKHSAFEL